MIKKVVLAVCLLSVIGAAAAAGVRVQTVESQGVGETREDAVKAALSEAVQRVAGLQLDARDAVRNESESSISTTGTDALTQTTASVKTREKLQQEVKTATRGTVRSYQVISVTPPDGKSKLYRAKLSVDVNYFQPGQETNRMRIAILPFKRYARLQETSELQKLLIKLNQSLVSYLTGTRHFAVLDRDFLDQRLEELDSLRREDVRLEERARIGNSLAADYIVTGVVTDFTYADRVEETPFTHERVHVAKGNIGIQWRVIEASTGQILASDTILRELKSAASFSNGGMELGEQIGSTITGQIYPLAAIAFEGGHFLLAQGGVTLRVGDYYQLVRQGAIRVDPYTNEQMGRDEIPVGEVRISRVSPKLSYAEIVSCNEDPSGMAPREYLLRPFESSRKTSGKAAKKVKTQQPKW